LGKSEKSVKNYDINSNILSKDSEEEILLIDLGDENDVVLSIQGVSMDFWKLINEDKKQADIIKTVTKEYEVDKAIVEKDFKTFLDSLVEREVLKTK
jgi:hypothetical protein